ncbi:UNVERIFIED_CONTAM: hypothetical protein Sangu_3123000 [Sesamum angustifolium]|uniref:DUF4283 domain-containing protein n=1 Tax=Sesamum angustifolium TaxID=2727405 RepID=A0AAW2K0K2_9LAMI
MEVFYHKLGQSLNLTEREGAGVVIPDSFWSAGSEDFQLFLVGRLLSTKQPKFEALVHSIKSMLNPVKGLEMQRPEEGLFLIRFNYIIDQNPALKGYPWSFEKNSVILNCIGINENSMNVDLDWCEFFVHVHDLSLSKMTFGMASFIGNSIGKFREIEMDDSGRSHTSISCELRLEEGFKNPGEVTPYGSWLRAPPGSWGWNRVLGEEKGVVHAESEAAHRKVGKGMVDDVHFASSDGLGSHVPETALVDRSNGADNDIGFCSSELCSWDEGNHGMSGSWKMPRAMTRGWKGRLAIHRFFGLLDWQARFPNARVSIKAARGSDYTPLINNLNAEPNEWSESGRGCFNLKLCGLSLQNVRSLFELCGTARLTKTPLQEYCNAKNLFGKD